MTTQHQQPPLTEYSYKGLKHSNERRLNYTLALGTVIAIGMPIIGAQQPTSYEHDTTLQHYYTLKKTAQPQELTTLETQLEPTLTADQLERTTNILTYGLPGIFLGIGIITVGLRHYWNERKTLKTIKQHGLRDF